MTTAVIGKPCNSDMSVMALDKTSFVAQAYLPMAKEVLIGA